MKHRDRIDPMNGRPGFGFLSGLFSGLSVLGKLYDHRYKAPSLYLGSIGNDWKAVGGDIRSAMRVYDEQSKHR